MRATFVSDPLVEILAEARRSGGAVDLPRALSVAEGYAVADALALGLGEPAGWKIGATSLGGQAVLGTGEPIRGRVFRHGVVRSPAAFAPPGDRACEAEPEIIFELGERPGEVVRAFLGIEIVRPSRDDALEIGAGFIVADNAAHVALVLGPELPIAALDDPAALGVTIERNGGEASSGSAAAVLGDPRHALAWLATAVALRPGDLIATGAMCRAVAFARGDAVKACFGVHGVVEVRWPSPSEVMGGHRL